MSLGRRGLLWSGLTGTVGAAIIILLLDPQYGARSSVVAGFSLGVAAVGVLSASVLTAGTAGSLLSGEEPRTTQILLAGAGVLFVVVFVLLFVSKLTTERP